MNSALSFVLVSHYITSNKISTLLGSGDKVRTITAIGADDNTVVELDDYAYTFLDSGRTIAATCSCTVGVWGSEDEQYSYFTQDYFVEFYVGGGGTVY